MFNSDIRKNITEETKAKWNKRYKEYLPNPYKEVSKYFLVILNLIKNIVPPQSFIEYSWGGIPRERTFSNPRAIFEKRGLKNSR